MSIIKVVLIKKRVPISFSVRFALLVFNEILHMTCIIVSKQFFEATYESPRTSNINMSTVD